MKKILPFITAANQFLLLGVLLFLVFDFFESRFGWRHSGFPEPEIPVVSDPASLAAIPEEDRDYQIEYRATIGDAHVFEVKRRFVASPDLDTRNASPAARRLDLSSERDYTVNVLIAHGMNEVTRVFEQDVLITDLELPRDWGRNGIDIEKSRIVYSVIRIDTNGDGILSPKDRISLYSSNTRGEDLKVVVEPIDEYVTITQGLHDKVVVTRTERNIKRFWIYNPADEGLLEVSVNRSPDKAGKPTP